MHVGTAVGAVAAIGGLIFTGIATYYSALIASDQLQQSREDSVKGERVQAEHVSYYVEFDRNYRLEVHLRNNSSDPVYDVNLLFRTVLLRAPMGDAYVHYQIGGAALDMGPCQELIYHEANFVFAEPGGKFMKSDEGKTQTALHVLFLQFTDRAGRRWMRSSDELTPHAPRELRPSPEIYWVGEHNGPPEVRPLEGCGSGALGQPAA
ncbi:hypothetical protein ABZT26_25590 [Streptomyces sp. NPDC005395]|uniref:hypothetical protein n=1 Tax=Streptomyces sp. NPDC005395 TaxID=3157042 RepID=UPI0033A7B043